MKNTEKIKQTIDILETLEPEKLQQAWVAIKTLHMVQELKDMESKDIEEKETA